MTTPLPGVKKIIAVASGKGGVGKSTVSANLALALSKMGYAVGILDADIYGPSIPTMLGVIDKPTQEADRIVPVTHAGLKVMSMGFFMSRTEAAVLRGPMLHSLMRQLTSDVIWGDLDYLVMDLPPGTGDVQLSLCQSLPLMGTLIVSTPEAVALEVAQKAIAMCKKLGSPIIGMIENMSHYVCRHCGARDDIFGSEGVIHVAHEHNIPFLGGIPLATVIRESCGKGTPIVLAEPESAYAKSFLKIAGTLDDALIKQCAKIKS